MTVLPINEYTSSNDVILFPYSHNGGAPIVCHPAHYLKHTTLIDNMSVPKQRHATTVTLHSGLLSKLTIANPIQSLLSLEESGIRENTIEDIYSSNPYKYVQLTMGIWRLSTNVLILGKTRVRGYFYFVFSDDQAQTILIPTTPTWWNVNRPVDN